MARRHSFVGKEAYLSPTQEYKTLQGLSAVWVELSLESGRKDASRIARWVIDILHRSVEDFLDAMRWWRTPLH
jgi:hypothetical protein